MMSRPLLAIHDVSIDVNGHPIAAHVHLDIPAGQITALVGGSGSGKTTLALAILGLLPPVMRLTSGCISLNGKDISSCSCDEMRMIRGKDIGMVFQEPLSAFDPLFTIGAQLDETLAAHIPMPASARQERILKTLQSAGIDDPVRIAGSYPHELSGGLRQRAMIAQAIICGPMLIIADEPTSSLDVTVQAKIIDLLKHLNRSLNMSILLIAHDLGMVSAMADTIAVMHQGTIVEQGKTKDVLTSPRHTYTQQLLEAY